MYACVVCQKLGQRYFCNLLQGHHWTLETLKEIFGCGTINISSADLCVRAIISIFGHEFLKTESAKRLRKNIIGTIQVVGLSSVSNSQLVTGCQQNNAKTS